MSGSGVYEPWIPLPNTTSDPPNACSSLDGVPRQSWPYLHSFPPILSYFLRTDQGRLPHPFTVDFGLDFHFSSLLTRSVLVSTLLNRTNSLSRGVTGGWGIKTKYETFLVDVIFTWSTKDKMFNDGVRTGIKDRCCLESPQGPVFQSFSRTLDGGEKDLTFPTTRYKVYGPRVTLTDSYYD